MTVKTLGCVVYTMVLVCYSGYTATTRQFTTSILIDNITWMQFPEIIETERSTETFESISSSPSTAQEELTSGSTYRTSGSTASSTRGRSSASRITSSTLLKEFTIGTESAIVTESDSTSSYLSTEQQQLTTSSIDQPHPRALPLVIIISVPVVILVLLIVVVALLIWRCGRHNNSPSEDSKQTQNCHPIKVSEFNEHCKDLLSGGCTTCVTQYQNLKHKKLTQPVHAGNLLCNKLKNRFIDILPPDPSRVKLLGMSDQKGSDYINASWMSGYNSIHEFIVSQAPLDTTVDDHWRMIWEYNCLAIVMLTKSIENGRVKCNHYWPYDREPMFYNDLKVQIVRETVDLKHTNPEYIITYMTLSQGEELRLIKHFHYLAWPEDGLPDNPESVIHFTKLVRTFLAYDSPTVVHCSSGIGRSGIFILIDRLFQTITEHDEVDIAGILHEMWHSRPFIVQTMEQYIFIHKCLVFELECGNNADKELYPETDEGNIYLNIVMGKEESQTDEHIQLEDIHKEIP